ncbi:serine/threonine-protein kinase Sgk2 [Xylaria scruposa]|nr:serine/threonine-protein kinase Sgk2 [Xylaria scruposa]
MELTDDQDKIIWENRLELGDFEDKLRDDPSMDNILELLRALSNSPAADKLYHRDEVVSGQVFKIRTLFISGKEHSLAPFSDLIDDIVEMSSPDVIWVEIFRLIDYFASSLFRPTQYTPIPIHRFLSNTFESTPCNFNSRRLPHSALDIESELFQEIKECTFRDVKGFCETFFPVHRWDRKKKQMVSAIMQEHNGQRWKDFPADPIEKPVWVWLCTLEQKHLEGARNTLHTTDTFDHGRTGQLDVFLQRPHKDTEKKLNNFSYKDVLVIGEHMRTPNTGGFKADFLQLTRYVRNVFWDQPTRRFIHAFSLCGSIMELWVFDRSGPYSSGAFNIHEEPIKFASALVGYATMDAKLAGSDMFISRHSNRTLKIGKQKFTLDKAMTRSKAIVCRGTTCYTTDDGDVVKFSWGPTKREPESAHLKRAADKGVEGVARLVACHKVTTIEEIRRGLKFKTTDRYEFRDDNLLLSTSSNKRKSESNHMSSRSKRRQTATGRVTRQKSKLAKEVDDQLSISKNQSPPGPDLWEHKIYYCLVIKPAGRIISDFKTPKELLEALRDAIKAHRSLYVDGGILHRDISPNNIIITDKAKTGFHGMLIDLDQAKQSDTTIDASGALQPTGTVEFMAIEVLRSIDHTYRHDLESFFYVLIWMCALELSNGDGNRLIHERLPKWGAGNFEEIAKNKLGDMEKTGFREILNEFPVESSSNGNREKLIQDNERLLKWGAGSFQEIAETKEMHMGKNGFDRILNRFPEAFKSVKDLCSKIRDILFPYTKDHCMLVETAEGDANKLYYEPIIAAYDDAIRDLIGTSR